MLNKNSILLIISFAIIFYGCGRQADKTAAFAVIQPIQKVENENAAPPTQPDDLTGIITLRDAVARALVNSPKLKAFSLDIRIAEARKLQASLPPNPQIDVEVEEFGGTGDRSGLDSSETSIQIGQLIDLADKRSKRTHLAALEKDLAELDFESKRLDVISDVAKAFIDVLTAQEQLNLSKELVTLSENIYSTVAERVSAGEDSPVEQTKAKIALSNTQIEFEKAGRQLVSARHRLAATWGGSNPVFETTAGKFYDISPAPALEELAGLIPQNPDLIRWQAEKKARRAALELEKAKAASDIKLGGGVRYFNEGDDSAFILGVTIPFPLYDRNQGNIRQATYRLSKSEQQYKAAEADLRADLADAVTTLSSSSSEITIIRNNVLPLAQSAFDAAGQGYREGKFEYMVELDAQRTLFEVRARYIEALAGYHKARADVERLVGRDINNLQNYHQAKNQ